MGFDASHGNTTLAAISMPLVRMRRQQGRAGVIGVLALTVMGGAIVGCARGLVLCIVAGSFTGDGCAVLAGAVVATIDGGNLYFARVKEIK